MLVQDNRVGKFFTPLGKDVLALVEFKAQEGLSELFEFDVEALSETEDIDFDKALGLGCHVEINVDAYGARAFHGVLTEARWLGMRDTFYLYKVTLRPWLWLLGKTSDCKIFHDKTVLDIIREVFASRGFSDYKLATTETYPVLHYTVQYRETDLNFVCRLMEQHGIYYFFEHGADNHTLVLADAPSSHKPAPNLKKVVFQPLTAGSQKAHRPHLHEWRSDRAFRSGRFELNDYNHLTPNTKLVADADAARKHAHSQMEMYDHPGPHFEQGHGGQYAKILMQAEGAGDHIRAGGGYAVPLFPGATFRFSRHPRKSENGEYLVTRITQHLRRQQYRSNADQDGEEPFQATYQFLKLSQPYRAPLITEAPLVHSLQTALVVGAPGEEIDCDDHGRILVHFYWDRHNDRSCRVRVSQVWGSKTWGAQVIPRIGMEVMVAYIDGDPDRPIVVGTVPDPENNTVPYKLPADKTKMVLRSNTHKGSGFNEMSFEDDKGRENFLLHAQKDFTGKVLNNHTHRVDNSSATSVGQHQASEVGGNSNNEVGGSQTNVVGGAGPGVAEALAPLMGLMGQTAGLAGQAAGLAGGLGSIQGLAMGVIGQAAQALVGASGLSGRAGVTGGGSTRGDQGAGLASAGAQLLQGVGQMFGQSGVQKNIISQAQVTAVGQVATETIGTTKVTHVGSTFFTQVGKKMKIEVGEELEIVVGKSHLVMRKDGSVILNGTRFVFTASGPVEVYGSVIDLNKPG